jgi:hypothetical protein
MNNRWPQPAYLPTPDEIERECEAIQQRWSERERLRRLIHVVTESKDYAIDDVEILRIDRLAEEYVGNIRPS